MSEDFRIYKPNMKGTGAASKLQLVVKPKEVTTRDGKKITVEKMMVFWECAMQTGKDANGNASFAWEDESKRITLKLGDPDIGEILCVLSGKKDFAGPPPKQEGGLPPGLFHKSPKGNSTFSISRNDSGDFRVRVSSQRQGQQGVLAIMHTITLGEAEIVETLLRSSLLRKYGW